ncbi:hypothetical protein D3C80_1386600 [compost metagenome]
MKKTYTGLSSLKSVSGLRTTPFEPVSLNEWASDTTIINGAVNFSNHTQIKFRFEAKGGNNFFLDNIRLGKLNELGLHGVDSENMLEIYPNPAEREKSVILKWNEQATPQKVLLLDAQGRTVFETDNFSELNSLQIPLTGLDSGYYFVRFNEANGSYSMPLVVN